MYRQDTCGLGLNIGNDGSQYAMGNPTGSGRRIDCDSGELVMYEVTSTTTSVVLHFS